MEKLVLRLLGGMSAADGAEQQIHFRTDKVRGLLVYLVLESERAHQRQSLAALFWPEMTTEQALKNLRQTLHRLQQALAAQDADLPAALFTITRQTVQFHRQPGVEVDVHQFDALLAASKAHRHRLLYLCPDCLERLAQAAALYEGELLAGFGLPDAVVFEEWLLFWRERLQQQAVEALHELTEAHIERGESEAALRYAVRVVQLDPFREEGRRQLMRLYAARGEHTRALAQYASYSRLLQEELGVDPTPETTALYEQIEAERSGEKSASTAGKTAQLHHFPMQFTPFAGREQELQQIDELFLHPGCRLVTIVGPGGVGKTRLSQRAAERLADKGYFGDGIYFIPLASIVGQEPLLGALLDGLRVTPSARSGALGSLLNFLRGRRCLLVLDNFEQLLSDEGQGSGAALLAELLSKTEGLRLLVTSHAPLQLQGERRLVLGGLDVPQGAETVTSALSYGAVRLFVEEARQADPSFTLTAENVDAVLQLCRLVRGTPLALELAAVWVRVMDCAAIVRELQQGLDFLADAAPERPGRHRSLAAVFSYSWALLTPEEQAVLGELAIFHSPFSLDAAMAITAATPLTAARLLDRSLLRRRQDGRYEFHEQLRYFAARQGAAAVEQAAQKHSDYFLDLLRAQEKAFYGPQPRQAIAAVQAELGNIRQAWQWAVAHQQRAPIEQNVEALARFYQTAALLQEGAAMLEAALNSIGPSPRLLLWRAYYLFKLSQPAQAIELARQALALGEGDEALEAEAHSLLGELLSVEGQFEAGIDHQRRAIASFQAAAELDGLSRALRRMVLAHWRSGRHDEALRYFQQAAPVHRSIGGKRGLAQLNNLLAGIYYERDLLEEALTHVQEAQQLYEEIGDKLDAAVVASNLARLHSDLGQTEAALTWNQKAIAISEELGDFSGLARDLSSRGYILATLGELESSLDFYYRALDLARTLDDKPRIADFQAGLAAVYAARGDEDTALTHYDLALPTLIEEGVPYHLAGPLLGKAEILARRGEQEAARQLAAQAHRLTEEVGLTEYLRRARILEAQLDFAAGDEAGARQKLNDLLAEADSAIEQATVAHALWQMAGDEASAEAATTGYRQAAKQHALSYLDKKRLREVESFLGQ